MHLSEKADDHIAGLFHFIGLEEMASYHCEIKSGPKGSAVDHASYIARQGWHSKRGDLLFAGHGNLPAWAGGNPGLFWKAADSFERANGAAYRELVIALPTGFTNDQLLQLTMEYVKRLVGDKPHQWAVHAPLSSLEGKCNPHLHLMYSDRMPDEIQRPPEKWFSRYNGKSPSNGGCRKENSGRTRAQVREELIATRKMVADIQNEHLEKVGHPSRVDHRTLVEQGLPHRPERHLGPGRVNQMSKEERLTYAAARPKNRQTTGFR